MHGPRLVCAGRIGHFMPTTGVPTPNDPQDPAERQQSGGDQRWPRQYLNQPHATLSFNNPLLRVPKSAQLVHVLRDAHDQCGENASAQP
jgi:hypothetical protein